MTIKQPFVASPFPPFGVEVDVDLQAPLGVDAQDLLRRLFMDHHLLVFRDQKLTIDQQCRLMGYFGTVIQVPDPRCDYVSTDGSVGTLGTIPLAFHNDLTFDSTPETTLAAGQAVVFAGISLHAVDVTDGETSTQFASGVRAYEALTQEQLRTLDGLEAVHVLPRDLSGRNRLIDVPPGERTRRHPILWSHPVTGVPILYVNALQTGGVVGLPQDDSERLLEELFGILYAVDNVYVHRWRRGDVVAWDNFALQHARPPLAHTRVRTLQRVAISDLNGLCA